MKLLKIKTLLFNKLLITILMISCNLNSQTINVTINKNNEFQIIDGFGASDAWRCQFVGQNWPQSKKDRIAELLFSQELDENGNPKGIGLSIWRFYIGAGTAEQGDLSGIKNEWRRGESFVDGKGNYDWSKQEGQQWFLKKAKHYNVNKFLAFSISAPVHWTKNGKGFNGDNKDGEINLKAENFDDYAQFMIEFLKHFKSEGVNFDYLSPINEPQWDWETKTQEGTPATNENISELTKLLDAKINENNLLTEIVIAEAADLRFLYSNFGKPERANQIEYFFGKNSIVKDSNHLKNTISGHSYFTTWPVDSLITIRQELNKKLKANNIDYWQSEFCILEKTDDIDGGGKRDLGINTALYVARVIHADLTLSNAKSWQWWTALTNADFKDGLIYLDTGNEKDLYNLESLKNDGVFHDSKLLWAFGNYSRFVRPGMKRIKVNLSEDKTLKEQYSDIMISAYKDERTLELVFVIINYGNENKIINLSKYNIESMYVTSKDKDLKATAVNKNNIVIEPRSVNTLIGIIKN